MVFLGSNPSLKQTIYFLKKFWMFMEKPIKANAMLEDFNKQNSRILENQDTLKQEDK